MLGSRFFLKRGLRVALPAGVSGRVVGLLLAVGGLVLCALPGVAQAVTCPSGNSSSKPVVVPSGCVYDVNFGTIHGSVTVQSGGGFHANSETITGPVVGEPGNGRIVLTHTSVSGAVNDSQGESVLACANRISGPVNVSGLSTQTVIGEPDGHCFANLIHGPVRVSGSQEVDARAASSPADVDHQQQQLGR